MVIGENGEIYGVYSDSDAGDPEGPTVYLSAYEGKFEIVEEIEDKVYKMKLVDLVDTNDEFSEASEKNEDVNYVYVFPPYGLEDTEDFTLYLPYSNIENESEDFKLWARYEDIDYKSLNRFVIRNDSNDQAFVEVIVY